MTLGLASDQQKKLTTPLEIGSEPAKGFCKPKRSAASEKKRKSAFIKRKIN